MTLSKHDARKMLHAQRSCAVLFFSGFLASLQAEITRKKFKNWSRIFCRILYPKISSIFDSWEIPKKEPPRPSQYEQMKSDPYRLVNCIYWCYWFYFFSSNRIISINKFNLFKNKKIHKCNFVWLFENFMCKLGKIEFILILWM